MSKSYVKLKNVGDAATFTVVRCAPGTGTYPDVEFEDHEGRVYPVPKVSADRQLERLGTTGYSDVQGRTITISRSENKKAPDKPFWNIELVIGGKVNGNGSGVPNGAAAGASITDRVSQPTSPQPPTQPETKEKDSALYLRMARFVLTDVKLLYESQKLPMTADAAAAITATLYIQAKR